MDYSVYVLLSLKDYKHYTGLAIDVPKRIHFHNSGKVKSTKSRRPFILVYQEVVGNLCEARKREKYFKSASGRNFLHKLIRHIEKH